jgi:hypothetical protein
MTRLNQAMEPTASRRNNLLFLSLNPHPVAMCPSLAAAHLGLVRRFGKKLCLDMLLYFVE